MTSNTTPGALLLLLTSAALLLLAGGVVAWRRRPTWEYATQASEDAPTWADNIAAAIGSAAAYVEGAPAAGMVPSADLLAMLKRGEALRLNAYRLGDGGSTIGYGRFYPDNADGSNSAPSSIDRATAEAWFVEDVEKRGAKWVRAYVSADLSQYQFDALVSMAYNLSPRAFRTIADAVNSGQDPEAAALVYVRAGSNLEAGLRARRGREVALYRTGVYT